MSTLPKIALRNLSRQKKRSFLLGGAIAFGVFVVTMINGFAGSFRQNVAGNMAQLYAGHVFIEGVEKGVSNKPVTIIRDDAPLAAALGDMGIDIKTVARRSYANATLSYEGKKSMQTIYGADLEREKFLRDRLELKSGSWDNVSDPHALILSASVAKKLNLEVGDRLLAQMKTVNGQNNLGEFTLAAISGDMSLFSSQIAYAHRDYINELLQIGQGEYQLLGVFIDDIAKAESTALKMTEAVKGHAAVFELAPVNPKDPKSTDLKELGKSRYSKIQKLAKTELWNGTKYRVFTINDMISQIDTVVSAINTVSFIVLLVLFLIIMVGINNTFRMIMYERVREIGTMRAVGMQRKQTRNLFLLEALFLSTGGTIAGWLVAGVVMAGFSLVNFGTSTVLAMFMKNGHLAFYVPPTQALGDYVLVALLTLLAALPPARAAARLQPAEALRNTK